MVRLYWHTTWFFASGLLQSCSKLISSISFQLFSTQPRYLHACPIILLHWLIRDLRAVAIVVRFCSYATWLLASGLLKLCFKLISSIYFQLFSSIPPQYFLLYGWLVAASSLSTLELPDLVVRPGGALQAGRTARRSVALPDLPEVIHLVAQVRAHLLLHAHIRAQVAYRVGGPLQICTYRPLGFVGAFETLLATPPLLHLLQRSSAASAALSHLVAPPAPLVALWSIASTPATSGSLFCVSYVRPVSEQRWLPLFLMWCVL